MKKSIFRFAALLLAGALVLGLVACGKEEPMPSLTHTELMRIMKQSMDGDLNQVIRANDWAVCDGRIWACGYQTGGFASAEEMELWVASADAGGSDVTAVQLNVQPHPELTKQKEKLAEENPQNSYQLNRTLQSILFDSGGTPHVVLHEQLMAVDKELNTNQTVAQQYSLCAITADGALRRGVVLHWPESVVLDALGAGPMDYFLAGDRSLWVNVNAQMPNGEYAAGCYLRFDTADGSCTAALTLPEQYRSLGDREAMRLMPDGSLLLYAHKVGGGTAFFTITDPTGETPALSDPVPLQYMGTEGFITALDGVPTAEVYVRADKGIYLYNIKTGEGQRLLDWETYGIAQGADPTQAMYCYQQNAAMQFLRVGTSSGTTVLSVIDEAELAKLPTITVAYTMRDFMNDPIEKAINAYNAAGNSYYIKAVDYTQETAQAAGFSTGMEMLQREIIDGTAPDVLLTHSNLDVSALMDKGAFVDLYPLIDADPQLSRQDFLPNILSANQYNGELPSMTVCFSLLTLYGDPAVVGTDTTWTLDDFVALSAQYPDAVPVCNDSRWALVSYIMKAAGDSFVDYETHTAHLDSPEFIELIQASVNWPEQAPPYDQDPRPDLSQKKALLCNIWFDRFRDIFLAEYDFGGPVVFKGYPSENNGNLIWTQSQVYINSSCKDTAAAWDFVRTLLLPAHQDGYQINFPVRLDSLQVVSELAQQTDVPVRTGRFSQFHYSTPSYLPVEESSKLHDQFTRGLTADQAAQVMEMLLSAEVMQGVSLEVSDIIYEELLDFYGGLRTAEEAAAIIQNRVQTYLDEQG